MSRKIYQNLEELISHNRAIFGLLGDAKKRGIYRAVWEARQPEIDEIKDQLELLRDDFLKNKIALEKKTTEQDNKAIATLTEQLENADREIEALRKYGRETRAHADRIQSAAAAQTAKAEQLIISANEKMQELENLKGDILKDKERVDNMRADVEERKLKVEAQEHNQAKHKSDVEELIRYSNELKTFGEKARQEIQKLQEEITKQKKDVDQAQSDFKQAKEQTQIYKIEANQLKEEVEKLKGHIRTMQAHEYKTSAYIEEIRKYAQAQKEEVEKGKEETTKVRGEFQQAHLSIEALKKENEQLSRKVALYETDLDKLKDFSRNLRGEIKHKDELIQSAQEQSIIIKRQYQEAQEIKADNERLAHELVQMRNAFKTIASSIGHLQEDIQDTSALYNRTEELVTDAKNKTVQAERDTLIRKRLGKFREKEIGVM
ncbi:MAG: hypothetical protein A2504_02175 [Bdellovibrionales bacterium RIFOXYD12_FULL_39_22]|nr:MAG: hypothetical protein A2385_12200 [Bdellovibrionales bacterium RIFOXYB1_FULL_39_21]OFZ41403.1 MAG: hypothetical protein A2485_01370 [Bdellovibrionales bacterium RIFOXYC12_FULL_39_17]OFZ45358.1 MAG: hypothetical protein A2404_13385 [Bdellovibrionales bacterium RIFOXYC1_FULL_39_130]OFZ74554.1 MAG: hypothetical protein A2560_12490 [Bdellovibrionales bacterium RIFOXYD1_FULL_39_84]OFZ76675.1 MAG: hypothetical protein A2451_13340 [Bdellovibrionales bacterium RIFOXYC2_FULL_39_8]OFZ92563.1 MAG: